jgi:hypothetical protein
METQVRKYFQVSNSKMEVLNLEDLVSTDSDLLETNIAVSFNRQIDFRKAKKCNLGVIQLLRGKLKGRITLPRLRHGSRSPINGLI